MGAAHPKFHSVGWAAGSRVLSPSPPPCCTAQLRDQPPPQIPPQQLRFAAPVPAQPFARGLGEAAEFRGDRGQRKRTAAWDKEEGQEGETWSPKEDGEGAGRREKKRDLRVVLVPALTQLPSRMLRQQARSGTEPGWVRGCRGGAAVGGGDTETRSSVHRGP